MHAAPTHVHHRPGAYRRAAVWLAWGALAVAIALLVQHDMSQTADPSTPSTGSGITATDVRRVAPFTGVELAGTNNVFIQVGADHRVVVEGDDDLLTRVTTDVRDDRLVIDTHGSFSTLAPMSVTVSAPTLDTLALSGSGQVTARGIDARVLKVTVAGSGIVSAQGRATAVVATLTGSGGIELQRLVASDAVAVVAGSGQIWVNATKSLEARVPGTGAVLYSGDPADLTTNVSGTGAVIPR